MIKAVITGDIIHSTKMTKEQRLGLFTYVNQALKTWSKDYDLKFEMYRGDGFQCLINKPAESLRIALLIKTYIRSLNPSEVYDITKITNSNKKINRLFTTWMFDSRIAIGIGKVESGTKTLASSNGEAFILSGRLLDNIKNSKQHLAILSSDMQSPEWATSSILLDAIVRKTSALQCEVLTLKLLGYTENQIAIKLNIGQSAVNQRSNNGDWNAIEAIVKRFEGFYKNG